MIDLEGDITTVSCPAEKRLGLGSMRGELPMGDSGEGGVLRAGPPSYCQAQVQASTEGPGWVAKGRPGRRRLRVREGVSLTSRGGGGRVVHLGL